MFVTRVASPPSLAEAANTSPCTAIATFFPSGDKASSWNWFESDRCSTAGPAGTPRREIATGEALPVAASSSQIPKSRSKAIRRLSNEIEGHRTRPSVNFVTGAAGLPGSCRQMFCAPLRSET